MTPIPLVGLPIYIGNENPDTCPGCGRRLAVTFVREGDREFRLCHCSECKRDMLFEDPEDEEEDEE